MSSVFVFIVIISALGIVCVIREFRFRNLKKSLEEKISDIDRISKLLTEKNMEAGDRNIRLQKLLEAKTDFVGIASHQLRTPITEIKWGMETLLDGSYGEFDSEQRARLEKILDSTLKMIRLIEDLLRLVRSEAGYKEYNIREIDLEALIKDVGDKIKEGFRKKDTELEYNFNTGGREVRVDEDMIGIVVTNLISNAFHYTDKGKIIIGTMIANNQFHFEIKDTGIGIPMSKQEHIFKKFQRAKTALQMYSGGIGLGLYIAKNIIEQHRGRIWFKSEEGKGTVFYFAIPLF